MGLRQPLARRRTHACGGAGSSLSQG